MGTLDFFFGIVTGKIKEPKIPYYRKLTFHEIRVNLSRVNFKYVKHERQFPIIRHSYSVSPCSRLIILSLSWCWCFFSPAKTNFILKNKY